MDTKEERLRKFYDTKVGQKFKFHLPSGYSGKFRLEKLEDKYCLRSCDNEYIFDCKLMELDAIMRDNGIITATIDLGTFNESERQKEIERKKFENSNGIKLSTNNIRELDLEIDF